MASAELRCSGCGNMFVSPEVSGGRQFCDRCSPTLVRGGDPLIGQLLSTRYRILSKLGQGGMGQVYLAEHTGLDRRCAIKLLPWELASNPTLVDRFRREAKATAQLAHPNIVQVFDVDRDQGRDFLAIELVEGCCADQLIAAGEPLPWRQAADIARQAALGLAAAHAHGILHRDIKPSNLMVTCERQVKVMDFGLARLAGDAGHLTGSGMILGTPHFMSPEQAQGLDADQRSDVYSLGATLYTLLAGATPFRAPTPTALLLKVVQERPVSLGRIDAEIPETLRRLVEKMMARRPADRHQSMAEVVEQLEALLSGNPGPSLRLARARARRLAVAAAAGVLLLIVALARFRGESQRRAPGKAPARQASGPAGQEPAGDAPRPAALGPIKARVTAVASALHSERLPDAVRLLRSLLASASLEERRYPGLGGLVLNVQWHLFICGQDRECAELYERYGVDASSPMSIVVLAAAAHHRAGAAERARPLMQGARAAGIELPLVVEQELGLVPRYTELLELRDGRRIAGRQVGQLATGDVIFKWFDGERSMRSQFALASVKRRAPAPLAPEVLSARISRAGELPVGELRGLLEWAQFFAGADSVRRLEAELRRRMAGARRRSRYGCPACGATGKACSRCSGTGLIAHHQLHLVLGAVFQRAAQSAAARRHWQMVAADQAKIAPVWRSWVARRLIEFRAGEFATALDPGDVQAWLARGQALRLRGDPVGAIAAFDRAIALAPRSEAAWAGRGLARKLGGDLANAIKDFTAALAIQPRSVLPWHQRGIARLQRGDLDGAIEDLTRAVALAPRSLVGWFDRGIARSRKGDLDGAIDDFTRVLTLDPRFAAALFQRGRARLAQGDLEGAIGDLTRGVSLAPLASGVWLQLGLALERKGDKAAAIRALERGLSCATSVNKAEIEGLLARLQASK